VVSEDEQKSPSESTATRLRRRAFQHRRAVIGGSGATTYAAEIYGTKPIFLKKINETVRMVARSIRHFPPSNQRLSVPERLESKQRLHDLPP
jgi:hypothetical protein